MTAGSDSAPPLGSASWCLGQEAQILASHLHNRTMCLNSSKIRLFLEVLEGRERIILTQIWMCLGKISLLNPCLSTSSSRRTQRDRSLCHHNLRVPYRWCLKSLHQEVAVATISLTEVEASKCRGTAGPWDFTPD